LLLSESLYVRATIRAETVRWSAKISVKIGMASKAAHKLPQDDDLGRADADRAASLYCGLCIK
jgi:hypothetical protein